jgi:hypothetical protein
MGNSLAEIAAGTATDRECRPHRERSRSGEHASGDGHVSTLSKARLANGSKAGRQYQTP